VDEDDIESRPVWDENFASELIGKLVLVGLTHCNSDGSVDRQEQFLVLFNPLIIVPESF